MSALLREYGTSCTIVFPLIKAGSQNFAVGADYTHVAGDVKISKDGGAAATATNAPAVLVMGNGALWTLTLTATEMQAASVAVTIIDAATKAIEDQAILIETYGDGNGALNLQDIADALLKRSVATIEASAAEHSLATLILEGLEWSIAGSVLTIKRTDGSTPHVTKTLTTTTGVDPITGMT